MTAMVKATNRSVRDFRAVTQQAKHPIPPRPTEATGSRGRYESSQTEVARLLTLLKRDDISEAEMRALTIRMAKLQKELADLVDATRALQVLGDEVVAMVLRHTS